MKQGNNVRIALLTVVAVVAVTFAGGGVQATHESQHETFGESGVVTVDQPDGVTYFTQELENEYDDPVVIMKPVGEVGEQPAHIRVRNVQTQSFEYQIEEWSSTGGNTEYSGGHRPVDVSYLVLEAGKYSIDGQTVEAGTFRTDHNFASQKLSATFSTEPVLFTQSQTENEPSQIVTRNQITYNSESDVEFQTLLQEEEGANGNHAVETVGYVAVEQGTGSLNGVPFEVGKTPAVVEETNYNIDFENQYSSSGRFIAGIQTYNGQDTAQPRLSSLSSDSASVFIEEETTGDDETTHGGSESIGYFAFGNVGAFQTDSEEPGPGESVVSWVRDNSLVIVGGIVSVASGGYLLRKRRKASDQSTEGISEPADGERLSSSHMTDEESKAVTDKTTADSEAMPDEHQADAEAAIEKAVTAKSNSNYNDAAEAYSEALSEYQAALGALSAGANKKREEIETAIESTRADLETVKNVQNKRSEIIDSLQSAEQSLHEAIVAYIESNQTVARIRFRQARDTFEDAHETIAESEDDLLTDLVEVTFQPDREPPSTTLSELAVIPETAATVLVDAGIETTDDLDGSDESPWTPAAVEELLANEAIEEDTAMALTLLSWWHGDESYTFETAEAVARRQQQAEYGFNQSS